MFRALLVVLEAPVGLMQARPVVLVQPLNGHGVKGVEDDVVAACCCWKSCGVSQR